MVCKPDGISSPLCYTEQTSVTGHRLAFRRGEVFSSETPKATGNLHMAFCSRLRRGSALLDGKTRASNLVL